MAQSIFALNAAAAHQAALGTFGAATDPDGRPLRLWWPVRKLSDRRSLLTVEADRHDPPIEAMVGPGRRESVQMDGGLPALPRQTFTFAAAARLFPAAVPPAEGVCFLAGPRLEEAIFYRCSGAVRSAAGILEFEASVER